MFEAHADIAIGADAKVIADEILDTLDEPALKRMASCHGLKTQVPGMSASGGRSTGGKERLKTILKSHRASCNCKHKDQLTLWKSAPLGQCTDPLLGEGLDMQASWFKLVTKRLQSLSNSQKIHMPDSEDFERIAKKKLSLDALRPFAKSKSSRTTIKSSDDGGEKVVRLDLDNAVSILGKFCPKAPPAMDTGELCRLYARRS